MPQFGSVSAESQKAISDTIKQLGDIETEFARAQENKNDAFRAIKNTYNDNGISSLDFDFNNIAKIQQRAEREAEKAEKTRGFRTARRRLRRRKERINRRYLRYGR